MFDPEIPGLQDELALSVTAAGEGVDWDRIESTTFSIGGFGSTMCLVFVGDEATRVPVNSSAALEIQDRMYTPEGGTWFSMTCEVRSDRTYHCTYNYDDEPEYADPEDLELDLWEREFTKRPRPWELIPEWNPVKQTYTEQQWEVRRAEVDAELAALRAEPDAPLPVLWQRHLDREAAKAAAKEAAAAEQAASGRTPDDRDGAGDR